ncbi:MAG: ABC transporter permease [Acidimicrobiales bacterium]
MTSTSDLTSTPGGVGIDSPSRPAEPPAPLARTSVLGPIRRASFGDVLRSEWTKFRTVRSTFFTLLTAVGLGVGLGALISLAISGHYSQMDPGEQLRFDPTLASFRGLDFAQLALGVLGILVVTSEYSTGMIRTSLAAVPRRGRLLAAKAIIFTGVALVIGEVVGFASFLIGQAILSGNAPTASLGQPHVLRAVIGAGLYLGAIGLLGTALGFLMRNTAAAISTLVAVLFVLPGVAQALPSSWRNPVEKFWPTQAGSQVYIVHRDLHTLAAWQGFGVMCAFVAIVLAVAFLLLQRRDA